MLTLSDKAVEVLLRDHAAQVLLIDLVLIGLEAVSLGEARNNNKRLVSRWDLLVIDEIFVLIRPGKKLLLDLIIHVPRASKHPIIEIINSKGGYQFAKEEKRWKCQHWGDNSNIQLACYYSISMKKIKDEEEYFLSGWEDREENEEYRNQCLSRQLQHPMQTTAKPIERPKLPYRTHTRNRSKEHCSSKFSDVSNLRKDKEFLQQYLRKESQTSAETHRTFLHEDSQQTKLKYPHEILQALYQRHHHYQSTELQGKHLRIEEPEPRQEVKEFLFSGVSKKKRARRKYLLKVHHLEVSEKPTAEVNCLFRKRTLLPDKPVEQLKEEKLGDYRPYKKNLKFPLFYRELNSNDYILSKEKPHTINLGEKAETKYSLKHCSSTEFTDDSIFSSKFIRA